MFGLKNKPKYLLFIITILLVFAISNFLFLNIQSRLAIDRLKELKDGQIITSIINNTKFKLEVARSPSARARGLTFRKNLENKSGMFFIFDQPNILNFYMKNTLVSLDIIFIDQDFKVINIHKNTQPLNAQILYSSIKPAMFVIELKAGSAEKYQILPGSQIEFII